VSTKQRLCLNLLQGTTFVHGEIRKTDVTGFYSARQDLSNGIKTPKPEIE